MSCCSEEISQEMWKEVDSVIERHRETPGALITVLREAQMLWAGSRRRLLNILQGG